MSLLNLVDLSEATILTFQAVLLRVGFLIIFLPLWGEIMLPVKVRILVILALTMVLTPVVELDLASYPATLGQMVYTVALEATLGFSVAFLVRLTFSAVQMAGQIAGEQMGFAVANVLAPDMSSQITVVAQLKYVFALLLFFAMNFHLVVFRAIAQSFDLVPPFQVQPSVHAFALLNAMGAAMFVTAIKMAAPIMAVMILVNVALGLINKAAPQVNVFIESFPIRIILGLFMMSSVLGGLARLCHSQFTLMDRAMMSMLQAMGGG